MGKYYAVKKGKSTGLFTDWSSCQEAIKGYSGAEYKSFTTEKDALLYLMGEKVKEKKVIKSEIQKLKALNQCNVYTSGSYDSAYSKCTLVVIIQDLMDKKVYFSTVIDELCDKQKTIASELLSAFVGLQIANDLGYTDIRLYSNYEGIKQWATKAWTPKNIIASNFVKYIDDNKDKNIQVYQLRDVDKEQKKELKYYVGYAKAIKHIITIDQIIEGNIMQINMEKYND